MPSQSCSSVQARLGCMRAEHHLVKARARVCVRRKSKLSRTISAVLGALCQHSCLCCLLQFMQASLASSLPLIIINHHAAKSRASSKQSSKQAHAHAVHDKLYRQLIVGEKKRLRAPKPNGLGPGVLGCVESRETGGAIRSWSWAWYLF